MADNICAICFRRISKHSLEEVKACTEKFQMEELERMANKECCSCGCPADLQDINEVYWCNVCLQWNSEGK